MTQRNLNQSKPESDPLPVAEAPVAAAASAPSIRSRWLAWLLAAVLGLVTLVLYWPATHNGFVNYDDDLYVTANAHVQNGLTWENLKWAFVTPVNANWHPLTLLSHMLDCQIYGLRPWGHHLTSLIWHTLNTVLVFVWLRRLTGALWRSALVAALFGWHPEHVESVAWVAERKDVLSLFFGLLTLLFYTSYCQGRRIGDSGVRPSPGAASPDGADASKFPGAFRHFQVAAPGDGRTPEPAAQPNTAANFLTSRAYWLAVFCFALGLMSKPMLVTWPFVLLLLDFWPLGRFQPGQAWPLVREKIPFFALTVAACGITYVAQQNIGAVQTFESLPLDARAGNAVISWVRYLGKLFWPTNLAVFYPHPGYWPTEQVGLAGIFLGGLTVLFWKWRRTHPFFLMGWLWYGGTLMPVIGLVQVGAQAMADRYAYIPSLGVLIAIVWGAEALTSGWRWRAPIFSVLSVTAIVFCLALTRQQLTYWQDNITLFRHDLAVTENNYIAHNNLGAALAALGQNDEAITNFQATLRLQPDYAQAHYNLGVALSQEGRSDDAMSEYQTAIRLKPDYPAARCNLGMALAGKGQLAEAITQYQTVVRLRPDFAEAHYDLGGALALQGQTGAAISQFQTAIALRPYDANYRNQIALSFAQNGQLDDAIRQLQTSLRLQPNDATTHRRLGNALLKQGQTDAAIAQFQTALTLKPEDASARTSLGIALTHQGKIKEAISQYQAALRANPKDADAGGNLGTLLLLQGRPAEAITQFQAVLRLRPDDAIARNRLGIALARTGRTDAAITEYQTALRLKPDYAEAHFNLGLAFTEKKLIDQAITQFQTVLGLKPDDTQAQTNLTKLLAQKNAGDR